MLTRLNCCLGAAVATLLSLGQGIGTSEAKELNANLIGDTLVITERSPNEDQAFRVWHDFNYDLIVVTGIDGTTFNQHQLSQLIFDDTEVQSVQIETGGGDDWVELDRQYLNRAEVMLGGTAGQSDNDTLRIKNSHMFAGLIVDTSGLGADDDVVEITNAATDGDMDISTGQGNDKITITGSENRYGDSPFPVADNLNILADNGLLEQAGSDRVTLLTVLVTGNAFVSTAGGPVNDTDTVLMTNVHVDGNLTASLGTAEDTTFGSDALRASDVEVAGVMEILGQGGGTYVNVVDARIHGRLNVTLGGALSGVTNTSDDDVTIRSSIIERLDVRTGGANDTVELKGNRLGIVVIDLGNGGDSADVDGNTHTIFWINGGAGDFDYLRYADSTSLFWNFGFEYTDF